jgi:small subunit ribosomal protein S2
LDTPDIKTLVKTGFHFGHRTSRWNPKMAPYILKRRNLIHIIDLRATLRGLVTGGKLAQAVAARGTYVLFVGTKKQAGSLIGREAQRCGMPYVSERWPGGLLTNYATIRSRLDRLNELEDLEQTGQIQLYGKKMVSALKREKRKIVRNLGGVRKMDRLPGLLVMVDPAREHIAVKEAGKLAIPIIALTDTDGDPENVDIVVPGNDDSFGAIEVFLATMSEAIVWGIAQHAQAAPAAPVQAAPEAQPEAIARSAPSKLAEAAKLEAEAAEEAGTDGQ